MFFKEINGYKPKNGHQIFQSTQGASVEEKSPFFVLKTQERTVKNKRSENSKKTEKMAFYLRENLTDVKNLLVLSKSPFEAVKGP